MKPSPKITREIPFSKKFPHHRSGFFGSGTVTQDLAERLKRNSRPTELHLYRCDLGAAGAEAAARCFAFEVWASFGGNSKCTGGRPWRKPWRSTESSPRSTSDGIILETLVLRPICFSKVFLAEHSLPFWVSDCVFRQALAEMLKVNTTLRILRLDGNQIGDSGVEAQRFAFSEGNDLPLDFTFCTSQALANALQHNQSLIEIDLDSGWLDDAGFQVRWVARSEESMPGAARWEALEQIQERLQGNKEAAAKAAWIWTWGFGCVGWLWNVAGTTDLFISEIILALTLN